MDIDLYCERVLPGPCQEPLNTYSNLCFFIAAWAAIRILRTTGRRDDEAQITVLLLILIGTGSTLFHHFGTRETAALDVLPIAAFQLFYLWAFLGRTGTSRSGSSAAVVAFLGLTAAAGRFPEVLNRSMSYFPALIMLLCLTLHARRKGLPHRETALAAALFLFSLAFRSADNAICGVFPAGTHFLWHLLNALVLYLLVRGLIVLRGDEGKRGLNPGVETPREFA